MEAILKYADEQYVKIGIIGFSLGAATSLIIAARTDLIDSLISVSAPTEFGKIEFHFWDLDIENDIFFNLTGAGSAGKGVRPGPFWKEKEKPINIIEKVKTPTLFIHGNDDWLIKPWHSQTLYDKAKCKKKLSLIEKGPHAEYLMRENKNKKETVQLVREWFKETLTEDSQ